MIGNIDILAKELCKLPKEVEWNLNYDSSDNKLPQTGHLKKWSS